MKKIFYLIISINFLQPIFCKKLSELFQAAGEKLETYGDATGKFIKDWTWEKPKALAQETKNAASKKYEETKNAAFEKYNDIKKWSGDKKKQFIETPLKALNEKKNKTAYFINREFGKISQFNKTAEGVLPEISKYKMENVKNQIIKHITNVNTILTELGLKKDDIDCIKTTEEIIKLNITGNSTELNQVIFIYYRYLYILRNIILSIQAKLSIIISKLYAELNKNIINSNDIDQKKIQFMKTKQFTIPTNNSKFKEALNNTIFKTTNDYIISIKDDIEKISKQNTSLFSDQNTIIEEIAKETASKIK